MKFSQNLVNLQFFSRERYNCGFNFEIYKMCRNTTEMILHKMNRSLLFNSIQTEGNHLVLLLLNRRSDKVTPQPMRPSPSFKTSSFPTVIAMCALIPASKMLFSPPTSSSFEGSLLKDHAKKKSRHLQDQKSPRPVPLDEDYRQD